MGVELIYEIGNENSPTSPFGRTLLTLSSEGQATLAVHRAGGVVERAGARLAEGAFVEIARASLLAEQEGDQVRFVPGAAIAVVRTRGGGTERTIQHGWHDAQKLPGWRRLLSLLDSIVRDVALTRYQRPAVYVEGLVHGAAQPSTAAAAQRPMAAAPPPPPSAAAPPPRPPPPPSAAAAPAGGIPTTWPALLAREAGLAPRVLADLEDDARSAASRGDGASILLGSAAEDLANVAIVAGTGALGAALRAFDPVVPRALGEIAAVSPANVLRALAVGRFLGVQIACAPTAPPLASAQRALAGEIAKHARALADLEDQRAALLALSCDRPELVRAMVGLADDDAPVAAGATFGPNVQGFAFYLASARRQGLRAADVRPAFVDLVRWFPHKLAAGTLGFADLLLAAHAYHVLFEGRPAASVADTLHAELRAAR